MAVIGNKPAQSFNTIRKQTFTGTGDSAYSLDYSVSGPNDLEVFVNNVRQEPTVAYNAASQTLTMSEGIDSTDDFYAIYKAQAYGTTTLPVDQPITVAGATINGTTSFAGNVSLGSGYTLSAPTAGQIYAPGVPIQTVTHSWDTNSALTIQTYSWTLYPQSEIQITAKRANSLYIVQYQCPIASRSASAASTDIYYKVGTGGSWGALRVTATSGSNGYYGLGTLWGTNSSDDWSSPSLVCANVVTSNVGDTIIFQMALRSGGPGGDNLNGSQVAGHPHFTGVAIVQEIAQ